MSRIYLTGLHPGLEVTVTAMKCFRTALFQLRYCSRPNTMYLMRCFIMWFRDS